MVAVFMTFQWEVNITLILQIVAVKQSNDLPDTSELWWQPCHMSVARQSNTGVLSFCFFVWFDRLCYLQQAAMKYASVEMFFYAPMGALDNKF